MPLQFYNTKSRKKEVFKPIEDGHVRMYTCGPTVYDSAHVSLGFAPIKIAIDDFLLMAFDIAIDKTPTCLLAMPSTSISQAI